MAESTVSLAVERIADLLNHEAASLHGVREEVEHLQAELRRMLCFLKEADLREEQDEQIHNWVAKIRDLVYDAEDVIENFILQANNEGRVHGIIKRLTSIFTEDVYQRETGSHIKAIQAKIADISDRMETYGISFVGEGKGFSSGDMQVALQRSYAEEEHFISSEDCTRDLLAQLMTEEDQLRVISIVGTEGLGKTTLARKVCGHRDVKQHFDCFAWVSISQKYAVMDVLYGILRKLGSFDVEMKEGELLEKLCNVLKEKRYLVVLDNIQSEWDSFKLAFPNGRKGSKVLLTTCNKEAAMLADPGSCPLEPPFLTDEQSWELLCRKAFPKEIVHDHVYPPGFEKVGNKMVRKCRGLPLAVSLLGGLLATKKSLDEWKAVEENINSYFNNSRQNYDVVNGILALAYHDLPVHLKPCFLYLGHFPEDSEIPKKKLIRLWIAEGFVSMKLKGACERTIEDLAERYLEELIRRSLVQVGQWDHTGRRVKTCTVHDLVRDLCQKKAQDENFLQIFPMQENPPADCSSVQPLAATETRRVALHAYQDPGIDRYVQLMRDHERFRSLLLLAKDNYPEMGLSISEDSSVYKNFRLLRVLVLHSLRASDNIFIPTGISNLIYLRYLAIKCYARDLTLPQSIGNLRNLLTLDVCCYGYISLPNVIYKLQRLRHLVLVSLTAKNQLYRIDTLRNLEALKMISAENMIRNDALLQLTNLRNLGIEFNSSREADVILRSPIFKSGCLQSLHMSLQDSHYPDLEPLSHCNQLTKLRLEGEILENLYSLHHNLEYLPGSLEKLTLGNSNFSQDPMAVLEKLPNLRILSLEWYSYMGTEMVCSANGFPQLYSLTLDCMPHLEEWRIEKGSMQNLRSLHVNDLPELRVLPDGLKFVTSLQELKLTAMKKSFQKRIQVTKGIEGEDFHKVQHVPSILVF